MEAPSQSPERSSELADLRRRAYGPDADIQRDPEAQRRLRELEDLVRAPEEEPPPARTAAEPDERAEASARPVQATDENTASAPAGAVPAPPQVAPRPWWKRIPLWAVAATSAVVGGAGVVIGIGIGLALPTDDPDGPDLTLDVSPGAGERGEGFIANLNYWGVDPGSVVPHEPFDAIDVWTARGSDESRCLLLSHGGDFLTATCAGVGLDPLIDFRVSDGLQIDFVEPLPEGTVIRFVASQGSVDVWVSTPGGQSEGVGPMTSRAASAPNAA